MAAVYLENGGGWKDDGKEGKEGVTDNNEKFMLNEESQTNIN